MTFNPTPEQQAIKDFIRDNPERSLMVDARAGAAKTSTIEMAAQEMQVPNALFLAFNKRIAVELETRIPSKFHARTLNSLGHTAWATARGGKRLELDADKIFKLAKAIIPPEEMKRDEELLVEVLGLARKAKSHGLIPHGAPMNKEGLIPDADQSWQNIGFELGVSVTDDGIFYARQVVLKSIQDAYQGRIDFDDQIYMSVLFGGVYPRYHTVTVDEAQDLSPLNHLQLVKAVGKRLIAVGDPYQAIYAFRGADNNSMTTLMEHFNFERLGLTYSFRCPKDVAKRQTDHVPDFKSWESCKQGQIINWPRAELKTLATVAERDPVLKANYDTDAMRQASRSWSVDEIPSVGAVLCRNNAPLLKLAFAIIKTKRPVKLLGRDIGTVLANLLNKIVHKADIPVEAAIPLLEDWRQSELLKNVDSESKSAAIYDRYESLLVLLEASGAKTTQSAVTFIKDLFQDEQKGGLVLASGHKAKGLEWDWVMHLDPWRIPSKQARRAMERGDPDQYIQEKNLKYVIETRTKDVLVFANLEQCEEVNLEIA